MASPKWETVTDGETETTDRLRIPAGWLYRTRVYARGQSVTSLYARGQSVARVELHLRGVSMVFVPDPQEGR